MSLIRRITAVGATAVALMAIAVASAMAAPPAAKTVEAAYVGPHSAELRGFVYLENDSGVAGFEYGETTAYGMESDLQSLPKGSSGWVPVQVEVNGLKTGTTYHFRLGAWSNKWFKVVLGGDVTFTTAQTSFRAETYPVSLGTSDVPELGFEGGTLSCAGGGASGELSAESDTLALNPTFSGCTLFGLEAKLATNGCSYEYTVEAGTSDTMDIACPEGKAIAINAGTCAISIPAQTGLSAVESGLEVGSDPRSVTLALDIAGLTYTKTNDGFLCPLNGTGTKSDGTVAGEYSLDAIAGGGEQVDVDFRPSTTFQADQYPATLNAQQAAGDPLVLGVEEGTLTCSTATATGSLPSGADQTLQLAPSFSGCVMLGREAAVSMNGCTYQFHGGSGATKPMDILCPAGKEITVSAGTCRISISAQTGLSAVEASNDTASKPQKLNLDIGVTGLTYTKTLDGLLCQFKGTGTKTDGTYAGTLSVSGANAESKAIGVGVSG